MKEYKIECKNPMEKSEVINLLVKIGYRDASTSDKYLTIVTFDDGDIFSITPDDDQYECNKCLSIEQLRSMAKPKEYLFKYIDGIYRVVDHDCQGRAIEIPEGADTAVSYDEGLITFYKDNMKFFSNTYSDFIWEIANYKSSLGSIVWIRHTQPEELPFVDDGDEDKVNHPTHYTYGSIECIDAIESSMTKEAFAGFLKGNVQKYMWRYENKGGVESLQKAQWYLNRLILLQSA